MKKIVVRYVLLTCRKALPPIRKDIINGGNLSNVRRSIDFDIRHGVTKEEVLVFLNKVRSDPEFSSLRDNEGSIERLDLIEVRPEEVSSTF